MDNLGTITVVMNGPSGCTLDDVDAVTAESQSPELPEGVEFLHGLVDLSITGCSSGDTVTVEVTYPSTLPSGATFWKYGPTPSVQTPHWYEITPTSIAGATVTYTLTDGAEGDDDLSANGVILDPAGPAVAATAVPTMPAMWFVMLAALLMGTGALVTRGRVSRIGADLS